jgi:membrane protease YdiL (CAAX protease family)
MIPMHALRNTFVGIALLVVVAGILYTNILSIPVTATVALAAAFLAEAWLYVVPGFEVARKRAEQRLRRPALALLMTLSAALPYCLYALPLGLFRWASLGGILLLAAVASFWYVVLPRRPAIDLTYVALVAAVLLANPFAGFYATPAPRLPLGILGQLMWTRVTIFACLSLAHMRPEGFGFWPRRNEWVSGAFHFLLFLPVGGAMAWALKLVRYHPPSSAWPATAMLVAATFFGMLWVVALREEFFFRGLLQRWLARWMKNRWAGVLLAAALFGLVHLSFRGFPNWRFAAVAAVAGVFYGRACLAARSVRAAMVAHALVNTVWRVFFY